MTRVYQDITSLGSEDCSHFIAVNSVLVVGLVVVPEVKLGSVVGLVPLVAGSC